MTGQRAPSSETDEDAAWMGRVRRRSMIVALVVVIVAVVLAGALLYVVYHGTNREPEDVLGSLSYSRSAGPIVLGRTFG